MDLLRLEQCRSRRNAHLVAIDLEHLAPERSSDCTAGVAPYDEFPGRKLRLAYCRSKAHGQEER